LHSGLNLLPEDKMTISAQLLKYFNRKKSDSTDKNHTRFRNDICNHWDLDYLSLEELEKRLVDPNLETTIVRKKNDL
jgi:hypothetical protein